MSETPHFERVSEKTEHRDAASPSTKNRRSQESVQVLTAAFVSCQSAAIWFSFALSILT